MLSFRGVRHMKGEEMAAAPAHFEIIKQTPLGCGVDGQMQTPVCAVGVGV